MTPDPHALLLHLRVVGAAMAGLVAVNAYAPRHFTGGRKWPGCRW
jgi:hypothetical protein